MNFKNQGLTVGELSIAIATFIVIAIIWSNFSKDKEQNVSLNQLTNYSESITST